MRDIAQSAIQLLQSGQSFAMAVILESSGSTPREAGACMLIREDSSIVGTIGGGVLEANIVAAAKQVIKTGRSTVRLYVLENDGAAAIGAVCGGRARTLVDYIDAADPANLRYFEALLKSTSDSDISDLAVVASEAGPLRKRNQCLILPDGTPVGAETFGAEAAEKLMAIYNGAAENKIGENDVYFFPIGTSGTVYIFGAGHCGEKLAKILHTVSFATVVIDDRAEFANRAHFPEADDILVPGKMDEPFDTLRFGADSYIVIVTRGHAHDEIVLRRALRTKAGYIGMIGSKKKRETIYHHLLESGFTQADIDRVYSPIGLQIGAETPEEIAISITGELIRVRAEKRNG